MRRCFLSSLLALVALAAATAELTMPVAGPFIPPDTRASAAAVGAQVVHLCDENEAYYDCPSHFDYTCEWRKEYDEANTAARRAAVGTCGPPGCRCMPGYLRKTDRGSGCVKEADCPVQVPIRFPNGTEFSPNDLSK